MQALLSVLVFLLQPGGGLAPAVAEPPPASAPAPSLPSAAADAAETPDSQVGLPTAVRGEVELFGLWQLRRKAVTDGDEARADDLHKQVLIQRHELGIQRLDGFALDLLDEAGRAATVKLDLSRSQMLVDQARALSPGLPEIETAQATWALERQPWALHRWLVHTVKAMSLRLQDFQRRTLLASDLVWTTLIIAGALIGLFLVAQFIRHGLALYLGLGRTFPSLLRVVVVAAAGLLMAIPLYFGFGPLLLVFPFLILLWPLQRASERVVCVACVVVLGGTPWVLRAVDRLSAAGTGATHALYELGGNPHHPRAAAAVAAVLDRQPSDWQAMFVLGVALKRQGKLDAAIASLDGAARHVPPGNAEAARLQNDLGNAFFASGRSNAAEKAYLEAIRLDRRLPEPYFNISRLYTRTARVDKARERFAEGSALDPERVARWNADFDPNLNRFVVDLGLSADALTRRELETLLAPSPLATRAWLRLAGPVPEAVAPLGALVVLVVFTLLALIRRRTIVVVPCSRCAFSAEVHLGGPESAPLCEQCQNLFIRNIPVDRRVRFEKEERIARYAALRLWGLRAGGLVFPGFASFLRGRAVRGCLVAGLAVFLALRIALPEGILYEPYGGRPTSDIHGLTLAIGLGVLWVVGFIRTWRSARELA